MPKIWILRRRGPDDDGEPACELPFGTEGFDIVELPERPWTEDVAAVDAFVFLGREPVHPKFFGWEAEADHDAETMDAEDLSFVKKCLSSWKPVLWIGRGAYLVAAYYGSQLVSNPDSEGSAELIPEPVSFLDGHTGKEWQSRPNVPRDWAQSFLELADELIPSAFSERGEILAAEASDGAPVFILLSVPDSWNPAEAFLESVIRTFRERTEFWNEVRQP